MGRGGLQIEKEGRESWRFYKIHIFGLKLVLEKDFEALRGAELMKMRCRSVWDISRGLKPSKMAEKCDFARIFVFSPKTKIRAKSHFF